MNSAARLASVRLVEVRPCRSTSPSTALVDGGGANRFQARSPCLQVSARSSTFVYTLPMNSASPRTVTLDVVYDPPRHHCWLSAVRGCQPSAIELSRSPLPVFGTVCRTTSRRHHLWLSSTVASRRISSGAAFHNVIPLLCLRSDTRHVSDTLIVSFYFTFTYWPGLPSRTTLDRSYSAQRFSFLVIFIFLFLGRAVD